ncbi:DoxX family protein [Roseomonas sp. CCTCC AB2023176]|uniref:DoxX family protein n=1 Tax=Roseomonas sp. CCTCC AB2023176 TaxID=3342640 RepID=UPI0035E10429
MTATGARTSIADGQADLALLVGRVMIGLLFLAAGLLKVTDFANAAVASMVRSGLPAPTVVAALVTALEVAVPLLLMAGFYARPAAVVLALFTLAATFVAHRFWEFGGAAWYGQFFNFWKNLAVMGGLFVLAAIGPGRYAMRP